MKIILNSTLQASKTIPTLDLSFSLRRLANIQYKLDRDSTYQIIHGDTESHLKNSGLVGLLSHCYSQHLPVAIAPHDVWILLLSEITKEVATNTELYRQYFTNHSTKENIYIPSDSMTELPISVLSEVLVNKVLFNSQLIFKNFSTETPIITQTIQAIFCDMASPYYNYMMYCCGIPSIQLLGTSEDWEKLLQGFNELVQQFNTPALQAYFNKAQPILTQFINASQGQVDIDFWKNIFTQKNVGSGGDLTINGWIVQLFITQHDFTKITHFTSTHGVVKYKQLHTSEEFIAIYGGFKTQLNKEGFYELLYDKFTLKKVPLR